LRGSTSKYWEDSATTLRHRNRSTSLKNTNKAIQLIIFSICEINKYIFTFSSSAKLEIAELRQYLTILLHSNSICAFESFILSIADICWSYSRIFVGECNWGRICACVTLLFYFWTIGLFCILEPTTALFFIIFKPIVFVIWLQLRLLHPWWKSLLDFLINFNFYCCFNNLWKLLLYFWRI